DLIEQKAEAETSGSQETASRHAVAFAFEVLARFALPTPQIWMVPFGRNPFFTGREDLLDTLHEQLRHSRTIALSQGQAISGLGGIGKTQLAVEYAYRHRQEYPKGVLWARADSTEALYSSYTAIAEKLQLPERNEQDPDSIVQTIKDWLEN